MPSRLLLCTFLTNGACLEKLRLEIQRPFKRVGSHLAFLKTLFVVVFVFMVYRANQIKVVQSVTSILHFN